MTRYEPKDKFIGYVDILGYSQHRRAAEAGKGIKPEQLFEAAKRLGTIHTRQEFARHGPTTCPDSKPINRDLDYEVTQIFDCVVISAEPSAIGCLHVVSHCWGACLYLFTKGLLCRGYVTRGMIHHSGYEVDGSGHADAVEKEKGVSIFKQRADERGTPFIEVDPEIPKFIESNGDACIKKRFKRLVRTEGPLTALYPFTALSHSFPIGGFGIKFDAAREKDSNNNLRIGLQNIRKKIEELTDASDERALQKSQHYIRAIDTQLTLCDRIDEDIDALSQPFGVSP